MQISATLSLLVALPLFWAGYVHAAPAYGVGANSVEAFSRLNTRLTPEFSDVIGAAKASIDLDSTSGASSCFQSVVDIVDPLQSAMMAGDEYSSLIAIMINPKDRAFAIKFALISIETQRKVIAQMQRRLSTLSGLCSGYGGVIDKIRVLREASSQIDDALSTFQARISQ